MTEEPLTRADMEILEFERHPWRSLGRKEGLVMERFGLTLTRYTQRLLHLIEQPAAAAYDPVTVARLRRQRETWATTRRARTRRDGIEITL